MLIDAGSEGLLFDPEEDLQWVSDAEVIVIRVDERSASSLYKVMSAMGNIAAAAKKYQLSVVEDKMLIYLLSPNIAKNVSTSL